MYKFEKAVLDFITKAMKCDNETNLISIYHLLKNELNKIAVDKFEKNALEQFDVISWLESKINKKIFAETLKERTRKQKAKEFI
jgi:hypothetical protein